MDEADVNFRIYVYEFECNVCGHNWRSHSTDADHECDCVHCDGSEDVDRDLVEVVTDERAALALVDEEEASALPETWEESWTGISEPFYRGPRFEDDENPEDILARQRDPRPNPDEWEDEEW